LRLLDAMLARPGSRCAMVTGEPGIGRTALLKQVASAAGRVLWVRGAAVEAAPAYAGVADLLLPVWRHLDALPPGTLPSVQRDALAVALALCPGPPPAPLAICAGALGILAAVAEPDPLLIVVDDFQWLDPESRQVLAFVARRLAGGPVAMLVAARDEPGAPAERLGLPTLRLSGPPMQDCRELVAGPGHDVSATGLARVARTHDAARVVRLHPEAALPFAVIGRRPAAGGAMGGLDRLTPQEREIARAVAGGLSNAEAAATLFVSRKTVEAHLTRVYCKLGLRSRTELAREFARSER
jgi:DNA-binding CsgD family transcriptional regulator